MAKGKSAGAATIGVDYGTSTTQVSFLPTPGYPDLFRIGQGAGYEAYSIRSLIAVHPVTQEVHIGAAAASAPRPWTVLPSLKRCLRCSRDKDRATGVCTNPQNESLCLGLGRYRIGKREWSAAGLIQVFMSEVAKRTPLGSAVKELRFSVPPIYAETEVSTVRRAMDDAYGPTSVADALFEPTSALLTVSQDKQLPNGVHVVVDIGGGTTDVATLEVLGDHFDIHEPRSTMIAGDDFDEALFQHYRAIVPAREAGDYELREACRVAKEQLSDHTDTQVLRRHPLTRPAFDDIIRVVANPVVDFVAQYANERLQEFNRVRPVKALYFHLVGGASRIGLIRQLLKSRDFAAARPRVDVAAGSGISDVRREHLAVFCVALGNLLEHNDTNLASLPYTLKIYDGKRLVRTVEASSKFPVQFRVHYEGTLGIFAERGDERLDVVKYAVPAAVPFQSGALRRSHSLSLGSLLEAGRGATFHIGNGGLMFVEGNGRRYERWYEAPWKNVVDETKRREEARRVRQRLRLP